MLGGYGDVARGGIELRHAHGALDVRDGGGGQGRKNQDYRKGEQQFGKGEPLSILSTAKQNQR